MSVGTHLKGKNLTPYRKHRQEDGVMILVSPKLGPYATEVHLGIRGVGPFRKLHVEIVHEHSPLCGHG